jgi:hypothetical protein
MTTRYPKAPLAGAIALIGLAYAVTLYPGVGGRINPGDSAKFQFIGAVLGVPHEPGYPQYVVLTNLWTRLPLPLELALKVNLFSLACSIAAAVLFLSTSFSLTRRALGACLAVLAVFATRVIWTISTEAEVYALHLMYVALFVFLGERWYRTRKAAYLGLLLLVYALSFGNHTSMIALLPAFAALILLAEPRVFVAPKWIAVAAVALIIGLSQYGFLLWRANSDTPYLEAMPRGATFSDLPRAMFASRFTGDFFFAGGLEHLAFERMGDLLAEANKQFLLPALVLAAVGMVAMWRTNRAMAIFVGVALMGQAGLVMAYEIPDWRVYCAPIWLLLGYFLAQGVVAAERLAPARRRLVLGGLVLTLVWVIGVNFRELHIDASPHDRSLLIETAGPHGVVVTHEHDNYMDTQVDLYYREGLGIRRSGPTLVSFDDLIESPERFLADTTLYASAPDVLDEFEQHGVDLVVMGESDLGDWVRGAQTGRMLVVIANGIESGLARTQLAAAIAPLGLGRPLLTSSDLYYSGVAVKGASGSGVELTHPTDAILRLERGDSRLRGLRQPDGFGPVLPWPVEAYAGHVRAGPQNALALSDTVDLSRERRVRVFSVTLAPGPPQYESAEFDVLTGRTAGPYLFSTGTSWPIDSVSIREVGSRAVVQRPDGRFLVATRGGISFAVVGCDSRRSKLSMALGAGDIDELSRWAAGVLVGDWIVLAASQASFAELVDAALVPPANGRSAGLTEGSRFRAAMWRAGSQTATWIDPASALVTELGC